MERLYSEYRHFQNNKKKPKKKLIPVSTICCFIKPYTVTSTQRKMEYTFKGLLLPTTIEAKTVSLNNPRGKISSCNQTPFQQPESEAI